MTERPARLSVRVTPRASRSEITGFADDVLKVRLASPPVDGAANAELVKLLAKALGLAKRQIEIVSGSASRNKIVQIAGISPDELVKVLKQQTG